MMVDLAKASLKHHIAADIRRDIFEGRLHPGNKVTESRLAEEIGVSRGPVREAIQLLEMEGLLTSVSYKETTVSRISQEEVEELLLPMRIHIETYALKKAYAVWETSHEGTAFDPILEQMRRMAILQDVSGFDAWDVHFHEHIVRSSRMTNVIKIWEGIVSRIRLHFATQNKGSDVLQRYWEDHRDLVTMFRTEKMQKAVDALETHIMRSDMPRNIGDEHE